MNSAMTPVQIANANAHFGAPQDWDVTTKGECLTLPVRVGEIDGSKVYQSAWRPSREELDQLIAGQAIVLTLWGVQLVVGVHVERPAE